MAFAANFLRNNPTMLSAALRGPDNFKKAEEQGKSQLEGTFPQEVNSDGISPKVAYVTVNGQHYAVIGYPTYVNNYDGTYSFDSVEYQVRAIKQGEEITLTDKDKEKCKILERCNNPLPSNSSVPDDWHSIHDFLNNNNA